MTSRDISWESMVVGWLHTSGAKLVSSYEEILKLLFHKLVMIASCVHCYCYIVAVCTYIRVCVSSFKHINYLFDTPLPYLVIY